MKNEKHIIISIVEDEELIGQSVKDFINNNSEYICDLHYKDGETAVEGISSCKPDLVIMDIGLPGMNGVEVMKAIQKELPRTLFVMFTIFDDEELLFEALKSGASGYILKDAGKEGILEAINDTLNGGGPMSPSIAKKVIQSFNKQNSKNEKLELLTGHQLKILQLVSDGLLNKEIATELNVKEGTIKNQVRTIYQKLQVNNRVEASMLYKDSN